jgi:hypothetical protein
MLVTSIVVGVVTLLFHFCISVPRVLLACFLYYRALWLMFIGKGSYDDMRNLCGAPREAKLVETMSKDQESRLSKAVWLHTLALNFELWSKPHYRADSLRDDLAANFSNIAFPGTGFCMEWVCFCKSFGILYFIFWHPWIILAATCAIWRSPVHKRDRTLGEVFEEELLAPKHWFALWRINSTLVAKHHFESKPDVQAEYRYENKWDFLQVALKQSESSTSEDQVKFKVTPIIANVKEIVCKHKTIEGGMGIHMFKNAMQGGDWIIQERLYNCHELEELLPPSAPLSTFRVLTMVDPTAESYETAHKAMTFVFRAGRAGKDTDHSSILYAVDPNTLTIQDGKMFSNWYQVGRPGFSNLLSKQKIAVHPDTHKNLVGKVLSCAHDAVDICIDAHRRLMPNVPTIGGDVAVAKDHGAVLLEANLSCNFFGGIYDRQHYLRIIDTYYANDCCPKLPRHVDAVADQLSGA